MTEQATPSFRSGVVAEAPSWQYRIRVGNETFASVDSGRVSYDATGASDLTFAVEDDEGFFRRRGRNRRCDVWCRQKREGADPWHHIFTGEIKHVTTDDYGTTTVEAYGPRNLLARRYFVNKRVFRDTRLDAFMAEIMRRFNERGARMDIRAGSRFVIEKQPFQPETTLLEAVDQVVKSAMFVAADRPGYRVLVAPIPRPGISRTKLGKPRRIGPRDYAPGAFSAPESSSGPYRQVIAFRRNQQGKEVFRVSQEIRGHGARPNPNEVFWIPEFPGTIASARRQVAEAAEMLSHGYYEPKVTLNEFTVPYFTYHAVHLVGMRTTKRETKMIHYAAVVKTSTLDLTTGRYALTFDATKLSGGEGARRAGFAAGPAQERDNQHLVDTTPGMLL
ncbi:MAG: hypothetical protein M3P49_02955 [Actinomycetota bacterium]|nr:hypothetical protein [Actinomycetota bacterium]